MSSLVLLPAVDVAGGQAVRLVQGAAGSETSYGDPLDGRPRLAVRRARSGCTWSTWTRPSAAGSNAELLAEVVGKLDIKVEMSGGIRDDASLERALSTGCARVNIGTAAMENPDWVREVIASVRRQDRGRPRRARQDPGRPRLDAGGRRPVRGP